MELILSCLYAVICIGMYWDVTGTGMKISKKIRDLLAWHLKADLYQRKRAAHQSGYTPLSVWKRIEEQRELRQKHK